MRPGLRVASVAILGFAFAAACSSFDGETPPQAISPDAGAEAGLEVCTPGCGPTETCRAGKCELGCPDAIVYVSPDGNDGNSGCLQSAPKKTISGALGIIKTSGLAGHEVHVCRGTYDEAISVATDNVRLATSCIGDDAKRCQVCASLGLCVSQVFNAPLDFEHLLAASWTLSPNLTCAIAQGGKNEIALVPNDALKAPRTDKVSIGALELDGACVPQ